MMLPILICAVGVFQDQPPIVPLDRPGLDGRGRDPWVFRCIFEDRTRMVLIAPAKDWWMAFNPETCALHKVWRGTMDFRGKVWDFSQENSRAKGQVYLSSPSEIWRLADDQNDPSWDSKSIEIQGKSRLFTSQGATITSPVFSTDGWQRIFLGFDEAGRKERFRIELSDDAGKTWNRQSFESALSVTSDTDWQWNFKRIEFSSPLTRIRVVQTGSTQQKKLRNLRMYGDRPSWHDNKGRPLSVRWRGYELVKQTQAVKLLYDVFVAGVPVQVIHEPEIMLNGWREKITLRGIPANQQLELTREGVSSSLLAKGPFRFVNDGVYNIISAIPEPRQ